jgi:hypothetical protein
LAPSAEIARRCLQLIRDKGKKFGLIISPKKSLVWTPSRLTQEDPAMLSRRWKKLAKVHCESGVPLLGGSVTKDGAYASRIAVDRVRKCIDGVRALFSLHEDPQVMLLLLRSCLGFVKLNYCWRTTPPEYLAEAAISLRRELLDVLNLIVVYRRPGFEDFQQILSSLPISLGGLGITMPHDILNIAYFASSLDSKGLQDRIYPFAPDRSIYFAHALSVFRGSLEPKELGDCPDSVNTLLSLPQQRYQRYLTGLYYKSLRTRLMQHEYLTRPQFRSVATRHQMVLQAACVEDKSSSLASQWLMALPNPGLGQEMTAREFRAALAFRLLIPFSDSCVRPRRCSNCNKFDMDAFGYHVLSCQGKGNLFWHRHQCVQRAVADFAQIAGLNPRKDAPVTCLGYKSGSYHRLRPADILLDGGGNFPRDCVDITVVSPLSEAMVTKSHGQQLGAYVSERATAKSNKHAPHCHASSLGFVPFAVDVCGMLDEAAVGLIELLAIRYAARKGGAPERALSLCRRRISVGLYIGVSRQLRDDLFVMDQPLQIWGSSVGL